MIQERLANHGDLAGLSGASGLQTVRLVTWIGAGGEVEIYLPFLKIIVGTGATDNYDYGRTGNLKVNISAESGTLGPALGGAPGGVGFSIVPKHPTTNAAIAGFRLPHWQDARQLVCCAARLFWPLRTIGWDVALTPHSLWKAMCGGIPPTIWSSDPKPRTAGVAASLRCYSISR